MKCGKFKCGMPNLVFVQRGDSFQTQNGFHTAKIAGWYCPVCAGSYGGKAAKRCKPSRASKSGRRYGDIYSVIREAGANLKLFKVTDLCPPLTRNQAANNCSLLRRRGELKLIKPGTIGRNAKPAVYRFLKPSPTARAPGGQSPRAKPALAARV